MLVEHWFLVRAEDFEKGCSKIRRFLERYQLVAYEKVSFEDKGIKASEPAFWTQLQQLIAENRKFVEENLKLLKDEGFSEVLDLKDLPQGYLSKQLHLIVHFLDGFFGIDSLFYNLEEDSHWVSRKLYRKLQEKPSGFWLIKARGSSLIEEPLFEKLKHPD